MMEVYCARVVVQYHPLDFYCLKLIILHYHTQDQWQLKFNPGIKLTHCSIKRPNTLKVISRLQALKECEEVKQMSITVGPCKFS